MANVHVMTENDDLPVLEVTCLKADETPQDLSGATARLYLKNSAGTLVLNGVVMTVTDPAGGVVQYPWAPGETAPAGRYRAKVRATLANGKRISFPNEGYSLVKFDPEP